VDELQVSAICPAAADAVGRNEDGPIHGQLLQPVVRHVVLVVAARIDVVHAAPAPVEAKNQPVWRVFVVVVRKPHDEVAASDLRGAAGTSSVGCRTIGDGRRLAATIAAARARTAPAAPRWSTA